MKCVKRQMTHFAYKHVVFTFTPKIQFFIEHVLDSSHISIFLLHCSFWLTTAAIQLGRGSDAIYTIFAIMTNCTCWAILTSLRAFPSNCKRVIEDIRSPTYFTGNISEATLVNCSIRITTIKSLKVSSMITNVCP